MTRLFSRTDQSILGRWWWTVDRTLLILLLVLTACGIVMVTTASPPVAMRIGLNEYHFVLRHLVFLGPALALMFGLSLASSRMIWRIASIVLVFGAVAMVTVLFAGTEVKGAQRWIQLFGFSLQPSEFVKPAFAVVSAWFMARQKDRPEFPGNMVAAGVFGFILLLLLLQPDIGMSVVLASIYGAQIFLAGFPLWLLLAFAGCGVVSLASFYFFFEHFRSRIDRFLDPAAGDNYQVDKSLEAFQHGGIFGAGPGQGTVKLALPDAHADFIFAVAGEEMGLVFIFVLLIIFGFIILRVLNNLTKSESMFAILAAGGLVTMFGLQAVIHMGSSLSLLPAKGMTLPFISYGGSSLWAMAFAMGIILALTRISQRSSIARGGNLK